jgi:gamma-glutamylputrescine synthase
MSNLLMARHNIADEEAVPESMPSARQCCDIEDILFSEEIENYLQRYPNTRHVEICLHDLNGHVRGKRIDIVGLKNIAQGCYFPMSIYAMSLDGEVIEESGLGKSIGEPDYLCKPILGSLQPCALNPESNAQLFLTMKDDNHQDCEVEPRNILKKFKSAA